MLGKPSSVKPVDMWFSAGPWVLLLAGHRVDEAHLVGQLAELRQQVAGHLAALAARLEVPGRLDQVALLALKGDQLAAAAGIGVSWRRISSGL